MQRFARQGLYCNISLIANPRLSGQARRFRNKFGMTYRLPVLFHKSGTVLSWCTKARGRGDVHKLSVFALAKTDAFRRLNSIYRLGYCEKKNIDFFSSTM